MVQTIDRLHYSHPTTDTRLQEEDPDDEERATIRASQGADQGEERAPRLAGACDREEIEHLDRGGEADGATCESAEGGAGRGGEIDQIGGSEGERACPEESCFEEGEATEKTDGADEGGARAEEETGTDGNVEFNEGESDEVRCSEEEVLSADIGRPRARERDEEIGRRRGEEIELEKIYRVDI